MHCDKVAVSTEMAHLLHASLILIENLSIQIFPLPAGFYYVVAETYVTQIFSQMPVSMLFFKCGKSLTANQT